MTPTGPRWRGQRGWPIGVIDATPIRTVCAASPASYDRADALAESRAFLAGKPYVTPGAGQPHAARAPDLAMKVLIVAEYYPRAADPVLGIWAHRQAVAARDAGAEVRVLVLHRPLPPLAALRRGDLAAVRARSDPAPRRDA